MAADLARAGAPEGTLVVADHQSAGRGRGGTRWHTPPGTAIAMSVVLRPVAIRPLRWTGLGALAVVEALRREGLTSRIKWPNDVLLDGRKVAGVLTESAWDGGRIDYVVLGIGVNVLRASVPGGELDFPATSIEAVGGFAPDRERLIEAILGALEYWYPKLAGEGFLRSWESAQAFLGERVSVETGEGLVEGRLLGLGPEGEARVELASGAVTVCGMEARRLRPIDGNRSRAAAG